MYGDLSTKPSLIDKAVSVWCAVFFFFQIILEDGSILLDVSKSLCVVVAASFSVWLFAALFTFCRGKNFEKGSEYANTWNKDDDGKVNTDGPRVVVGDQGGFQGQMITRCRNETTQVISRYERTKVHVYKTKTKDCKQSEDVKESDRFILMGCVGNLLSVAGLQKMLARMRWNRTWLKWLVWSPT